MIKFIFSTDVSGRLFEELSQIGISVEENEESGYTLTRSSGKAVMGIQPKNDGRFYISIFPVPPIPFTASFNLGKEIQRILHSLGGEETDFLDGCMPEWKRRWIKRLNSIYMLCLAVLAVLAVCSYAIYGEFKYIFEETEYGEAMVLALGLSAAIGYFGSQGLMLTYKNERGS